MQGKRHDRVVEMRLCFFSGKVGDYKVPFKSTRKCRSTDSVQVHYCKTREEYDRLTSVIENRNGRIIIEVIDATVLDDNGNGSDSFGFYVKYDSEQFSKGDKVRSLFVYNPNTNYLDDIVCRIDQLME